MTKKDLIAAFREKYPKLFVVENMAVVPVVDDVESFLSLAYDSIIEEAKGVDIGQAPIKLMQDGQTMDFSFREGWNACKEKTRIALDGLKEV